MGHEGQEIFLKDMLVFLFAAGVIVPALRMLHIPAVAGFLIAGVVLGPYGLGTLEDLWAPVQFVTVAEPEAAEPFAELGILFLLFLIGLELSFEKLWRMRQAVFGTGALQAFASSTARPRTRCTGAIAMSGPIKTGRNSPRLMTTSRSSIPACASNRARGACMSFCRR